MQGYTTPAKTDLFMLFSLHKMAVRIIQNWNSSLFCDKHADYEISSPVWTAICLVMVNLLSHVYFII